MLPESNKRNNETWSSTTLATQNSALSTSRPKLQSTMSRTGFMTTPHSNDAAGTMGMRCSFRGCTSLSEDGGPLCDYHINYMIPGSHKAQEKPPNATSQAPKSKLHLESRFGKNAPRIKMTKTAPGPTFARPIQSSSKPASSLTATPRLIASPISTKSASRRRSILSPTGSSTGTGSPSHKKARQASGSFDLSNSSNKNHLAQPSTYEFLKRPNKLDQLPVIAPYQNGNHQHTSKDDRNGIVNEPRQENAFEAWDLTESDSWLPLQINQRNGHSTASFDSRYTKNGFAHHNSANQRREDIGAPSFFPSYPETTSLQASNGLSVANGLPQGPIRGAFAVDDIRGPRHKASPAPGSPSNFNGRSTPRKNDGSSSKSRLRASKTTVDTISKAPPMEVQRERLAQARALDSSSLDALIYNQEGAAEPPPGVIVPEAQPRASKDQRFFAHIDPRIHWCRPHSREWHEKKQAEIKKRGGRKANFGKAVERLKKERLENPIPEEELLPQRVKENPEWMRAREWFKECSQKDWEKDKKATKRAEAEAKLKAKTGGRRR